MMRYSFLWENPNHAGAIFAMLAPICWRFTLQDREAPPASRLTKGTALAGDGLLLGLLVLTQSRSGIVAWFVALVYFLVIDGSGAASAQDRLKFGVNRAAILLVLLLTTATGARVAQAVGEDASVTNRFPLWKGGLQLIAASPWSGWGAGEAGLAYMQWIQSPDSELFYGGIVSSYLTLAAESGLPVLMLVVSALVIPIALAFSGSKEGPLTRRRLMQVSASGLLAFAIAAIFNTLFVFLSVMVAPLLLLVVFWASALGNLGGSRPLFRAVLVGMVASGAVAAALFAGGVVLNQSGTWTLGRAESGIVTMDRNQSSHASSTTLLIVADSLTLGRSYGKIIRAAVAHETEFSAVKVVPADRAWTSSEANVIVVCGRRWQDVFPAKGARMVLLAPLGRKPSTLAPELVVLPQVDEFRGGLAESARRTWRNYPTMVIADSGQDLSHAFPSVMKAIAKREVPAPGNGG